MLELTDAQGEFRAEVARFAAAEVAPHVAEWDDAEAYPRHLFPVLGKLGWLGVGIDESLGGSGGGPVERCILIEEMARVSPGVALGAYVHMVLAAGALAVVASPELAAEHLPDLLAGDRVGAWAYAEPDSGADVTQVRLRARRDGDRFVLDGTKLYITNATFADDILVVARSAEEPGTLRGLSVLLVDGDTPGLTRSPMRKLGMRASETAELHFDGCRVAADRLVGGEGSGFRECLAVLTEGRIYGGALACGLARGALDAAVSHVMTREQFGGPLGLQQAVRFHVADMTARLRGARSLVYEAAAALAAGRLVSADASVAKLVASETATWIAERALHLHGAQGFMMESPVARYYRDCKVLEYGEGANEIQREMIFKAVAGGYRP